MERSKSLYSVAAVVCCILMWQQPAQAQTIDIGLKTGMNISSHTHEFLFSEDDIQLDLEPSVAIGYQAGAVVRFNITPSIRIQTEPTIILLGAKYNDSFSLRGNTLQNESRTELWYLQMPLVFQLSTRAPERTVYGRKNAFTSYHISGGAFGGYLLDADFKGTNRGAPLGIEFERDFSTDVTEQYANYDLGVLFGLGLEHGQNQKIGFETRALYSVIDTGDHENITWFKSQNMAITFAIYWLF